MHTNTMGRKKIMVGSLTMLCLVPNFILPTVHAQSQQLNTPPQSMQKICSQCHALEILGQCLTGDCASARVVRVVKPQPWELVLDRMKSRGANIGESERLEILAYLQTTYPAPIYPLAWKKISNFEQGGWNITSLTEHAGFLYAGFEGNGKILRTADSHNWQEVANTGRYTVYGITPFKNVLYAGAAEPDPEIWRSATGLHWQASAALPPDDTGIYSMGVFNNRLYAGTGRSWIYRSSDGNKWKKVAALKGNVHAVFSHWTRFLIPFKGFLYAGIEQGSLYRSADGVTWTQANLKLADTDGLRGAAIFKGALYVGTTSSGAIWKTVNGQVWDRVFESPYASNLYVSAMAVAGKYLFASVGGYVFRTSDGLAWEAVGHLGPYTLEAMAALRGNINVGASTPPTAIVYQADPEQKFSAQ